MKHIIIGTAGHIDHGKTTLIKALTGKDTDRLKEEKNRGISIELGFTYFDLPSGKRAGIVDVPGHERFIKNMLAGAGGIDLVLLVVAADEGVMPQTVEHLNILSLLRIKKGIIALTKIDLVEEEWLEMVIEQIKDDVKDSFLEKAKIFPVSSTTKDGLTDLIKEIDKQTEEIEGKDLNKPFRLPIDRVFSISGFGTIITGTLISGIINDGDKIMIYPDEKEARIRSIQVHDMKTNLAEAGQRVAVNIAGVKVDDIKRGDVIALPDSMESSLMFDAKLELLKTSERGINNRDRLRIYHGSAEIFGRVVLLDRDELRPGEEAFVQMRLEEEIACQKDDYFIIRFFSPMITIGGGVILEPSPPKRKRFKDEVIEELTIKDRGDPAKIVEQYILKASSTYPDVKTIAKQSGNINVERCEGILKNLEENMIIKSFKISGEPIYLHMDYINMLKEKTGDILIKYHEDNPLKAGMPKEELKTKIIGNIGQKISDSLFDYLQEEKTIKLLGKIVSLWDFKITLTKEQEEIKNSIIKEYNSMKYNPPRYDEIKTKLKYPEKTIIQVYDMLIDGEELIRIDQDIVFSKSAYEDSIEVLRSYCEINKSIQLGEFRDLLETSRKYAIALLDYFDQQKITKRIEDKRVLMKK
ncbi:MAG: selenocysteine-specific translation elongation factor [Firmicutes bacterium]|nr:selenocysteine-specific translation elongation factor [Bacillota bacterium]